MNANLIRVGIMETARMRLPTFYVPAETVGKEKHAV